MVTEVFNILNRFSPIYIWECLEEKDIIYNLCSIASLKQLKCNTVTYSLNTFCYKGATIRNDLPIAIKNYIILAYFQQQITNGKDQHVFVSCVPNWCWV